MTEPQSHETEHDCIAATIQSLMQNYGPEKSKSVAGMVTVIWTPGAKPGERHISLVLAAKGATQFELSALCDYARGELLKMKNPMPPEAVPADGSADVPQ